MSFSQQQDPVLSGIDTLEGLYTSHFGTSANDPFLKALNSLRDMKNGEQRRREQPSWLRGWLGSPASSDKTTDCDKKTQRMAHTVFALERGIVRLAESLSEEEVDRILRPAWSCLQQSVELGLHDRPFPKYTQRDDTAETWRSRVGDPWVKYDLRNVWSLELGDAAHRLRQSIIATTSDDEWQSMRATAEILHGMRSGEVSASVWEPEAPQKVVTYLSEWQKKVANSAAEEHASIRRDIELVLPACVELSKSVDTARGVDV